MRSSRLLYRLTCDPAQRIRDISHKVWLQRGQTLFEPVRRQLIRRVDYYSKAILIEGQKRNNGHRWVGRLGLVVFWKGLRIDELTRDADRAVLVQMYEVRSTMSSGVRVQLSAIL